MSYKQHQYQAALPDHPEALVMITLMRARTFRGFRYLWTEAQAQPAAVRAAPGCFQVKACIVGPRELLMITYWKDQTSLAAFFRSPAHLAWMRHVASHPGDLNLAAEIYTPHSPGLYLHEPQGLALAYPKAERGQTEAVPVAASV
jgi:quinol monooxygenase YgiN